MIPRTPPTYHFYQWARRNRHGFQVLSNVHAEYGNWKSKFLKRGNKMIIFVCLEQLQPLNWENSRPWKQKMVEFFKLYVQRVQKNVTDFTGIELTDLLKA